MKTFGRRMYFDNFREQITIMSAFVRVYEQKCSEDPNFKQKWNEYLQKSITDKKNPFHCWMKEELGVDFKRRNWFIDFIQPADKANHFLKFKSKKHILATSLKIQW